MDSSLRGQGERAGWGTVIEAVARLSHRNLNKADSYFTAAKLNQDQVDIMLRIHTLIMAYYADRKNYSLWGRIRLSLYWLGFGRSIKSAKA